MPINCLTAVGPSDQDAGFTLAWSPSGRQLAFDRPLRDTRGRPIGHETTVLEIPGYSRWTVEGGSARWSGSGAFIATLDQTRVRVWDARTHALIGATDELQFPAFAWRGDELVYAAAGTLRSWSPGSGSRQLAPLRALRVPVDHADLSFSADGDYFALVTFDDSAKAQDLVVGQVASGDGIPESAPARGLWWSTRGHRLLLAKENGFEMRPIGQAPPTQVTGDGRTMFGWDVDGSGALLGRLGRPDETAMWLERWDGVSSRPRVRVPRGTMTLALSPDGQFLATQFLQPGGGASLQVLSCALDR